MHEASLAGGVLELVEQAAAREGFVRVTRLQLEVGQLACVELHALRFALQAIAPGTLLAQTHFEFVTPAGQAWCLPCGRVTPLVRRGDACIHCGGYQLQPTGGTECRVREMWVEDHSSQPEGESSCA